MSISRGRELSALRARRGSEPHVEIARLEARAARLEAAAEALRGGGWRLEPRTPPRWRSAPPARDCRAEDGPALAEGRGLVARGGAADAADAHRAKQAETEDLVRRSRIDADAARREASAAKAALEDRDAALDVGVAVVRADPELARSMMRANARVVDDAAPTTTKTTKPKTAKPTWRTSLGPSPDAFRGPPRDRSAGSRRTSPRARGFRRDRSRIRLPEIRERIQKAAASFR